MQLQLRLLFTYIGVVGGIATTLHPKDASTTLSSLTTTTTIGASSPTPNPSSLLLFGFRIDDNSTLYDNSKIVIPPDKRTVTLYGLGLTAIEKITLIHHGSSCADPAVAVVRTARKADFTRSIGTMLEVELTFHLGTYHVCAYGPKGPLPFHEERTIVVADPIVPPRTYKLYFLWVEIVFLVFLHVASALFSGLTLGLMTLTVRELEIIAKSGSEREQRYANAILPLRRKGNQLLCTLLLGNTLCNATISILIDDLLPAEYSIWAATVTMLLLGEMLPQSICVNNALATGARLLFFAKFCMYAAAVFAWPISKVLDRVVGAEHESYDRKRLMELMKRVIQNNPDIVEGELKIAAGAINLKGKVVGNSMTSIEEVFMLPETATLNQPAIAAIARAGYTRIPVFRAGDKKDICDVLITKDLALIDPDDNYTVRMLCNIYKHPIPRMSESTTLFSALQTFRTGDDGHLAVVYRAKDNAPIGIITLEDVVEEILQDEIKDEFDVKRERRGPEKILWDQTAPPATVGKQLQTVTYQFCSSNEEAFKDKYIDKAIFKRMMDACVKNVDVGYLKPLGGALTVPIKQLPKCARLYTKDEMSDRYILILEGRAEVTIGQGGMKFEAGPFHRFGQELLQKLIQHADELCKRPSEWRVDPKQLMQFVPDFSVTVFEDCIFLDVTADMYIKALRMTRLQRETKLSSERVIPDFKTRSTPDSLVSSPLSSGSRTTAPLLSAAGNGSKEKLPSPGGVLAESATQSGSSPTESSNPASEAGGK